MLAAVEEERNFLVFDLHMCCNVMIHMFQVTHLGHGDPAPPWLLPLKGHLIAACLTVYTVDL